MAISARQSSSYNSKAIAIPLMSERSEENEATQRPSLSLLRIVSSCIELQV